MGDHLQLTILLVIVITLAYSRSNTVRDTIREVNFTPEIKNVIGVLLHGNNKT